MQTLGVSSFGTPRRYLTKETKRVCVGETVQVIGVVGQRPNGVIVVVRLRYNFRVYPEPGQRMALARAFGCARVVFNDGLRARREAHAAGLAYSSDTDLQKQVITAAKRTPERVWLAEVSSVVLENASRSAGKTRAPVPAQRVEAGTHRDGQPTVAGIPALQGG